MSFSSNGWFYYYSLTRLEVTETITLGIEAIRRLKRFRMLHKAARLAREAGDLEAVFPYGTNQAERRWNVPVESVAT